MEINKYNITIISPPSYLLLLIKYSVLLYNVNLSHSPLHPLFFRPIQLVPFLLTDSFTLILLGSGFHGMSAPERAFNLLLQLFQQRFLHFIVQLEPFMALN